MESIRSSELDYPEIEALRRDRFIDGLMRMGQGALVLLAAALFALIGRWVSGGWW